MKKLYSLIIMLTLLCMSWTAKAQTLTVYDGTATSSYVPVQGLWADAYLKCEFVIPADSLAEMANGAISQMTFYLTSPASDAWTGTFQVFMKEVENTTISAYSGTADATIVYQGTLDGTGSTMSITFSDNYTYNGGNLLIGVYQITKGVWKSASFAGTTVTGASVQGYSSSNLNSVTTNQRDFIPKTTFEYTPGGTITCAKPTTLNTSNVGKFNATLSWTENGSATSWNICLNNNTDNLINVTENPYTLTGLSSETSYTAKVQADCGPDGTSFWSNTVNFTTLVACQKPTNLSATLTPGDGTVATLNWTENGTATNWVIEYGTNSDFSNADVVNVTTDTFLVLSNLLAETKYYARVKADCGGTDGQSLWSNTCIFTPSFKIRIGSGTATNYYVPLNNYYNNSFSQQIYTAEELGDAAIISSVSFYKSSTYSCDRSVDIYMVSTSKSRFDSVTDWIVVDTTDLVFSGTVNFTNNEWTHIELTNPFTYDGIHNVAIIVDDNTGSYVSSTPFLTYTDSNRVLRAYYDTYNFNPYDPSGITSAYNRGIQHAKNQILILKEAQTACPKPSGLAASNITGHTADLNWNSTATAWQICVNGDTNNLIDVTEIPYTLTGLNPETTYIVKVRATCSEDGMSNWTSPYSFTTDIACPAPTAVTANNITGSTANFSWNGSGESYLVRYRTANIHTTTFFEDFENGLSNWTIYTEGEAPSTDGWYIIDPSLGLSTEAVSGSYVASSWSWNNAEYDADNWLVTPQLTLQGTLKFWVNTHATYPDSYSVLLSTGTNSISDFTTTLQEYGPAPGDWTEVSIDLSSYAGQTGFIALHHVDYDENYLIVDDFGIYTGEIPAGEWDTVVAAGNTLTINGLTPETTYEVQVLSNCGPVDSLSDWSSSYNFTTTELLCSAPSNLVISDTTTTGATLTWTETGDASAWQICLNNDEENLINVTENSTYTFSSLTPGTDYSVKVRANCGETESPWSEVVTFTTSAEIIPTVIIISGDTAACPGQFTTLTASTDVEATYAWSNDATTAEITVTQGTYTVTVTSPTGNQLFKTVTVIDYPIYETHEDVSICASELPYDWHGSNVVESGEYYKTIPTIHGCDSAFYLTMTVNPIYEVTDTKTICDNELPYVWNGVEFTEAGTQNITLQTINGCDSVVTMVLNVNPVVYGVDGWTICSSELPFTYQGIEFTEAGTKFDTLTAANGCDSIVTITLVVKESFTATDAKTICASELPYEWNGVIFTEAGTQNATLDAVNGCDSVVTMTLTVNPTFNTPLTAAICQGESYEFFGQALTESGVYTDTLQAENGCDSVITLTLTVNVPTEGTVNATVSVYSLPYILNEISYDSTGVYTQNLTNVAGCDSTLTLNLTVLNSILTDIDSAVCASELPVVWNDLTFTEAGEQSATFVAVNGADSVVTLHLTVYPVYNVTDAKAICETSLPYTWNGIEFTEAGTQNVTLQTINGCDSMVVMTLTVKESYEVFDTKSICNSELPYEWNGITFTSNGSETTTLTAANGCDSVVHMTLTVNPVYTTPLIVGICQGDSYEFFGQMLTEAGFYTDTLPTVNGCDSIFTLDLTVYPTYNNTTVPYTMCDGDTCYFHGKMYTEAGTYYDTLQTVHGCDSIITFILTVNPTYNTPVSATICQGESYAFFGAYLTVAGEYTHTLPTINNCDSVITLTLTVNPTYNVTDAATICASELPYTWNGVTFTEAGTQNATLETVNGCDSVVVMTLTVNPIYNVTDAATICASELPYTWNGVVFTEAGTQNATLETVNGCDSVVVMTLTVNPIYNVTDAAAVCANQLPYTWNGVVFTEAGTQTATLQSVNGCDSVVVMTLTVNPIYNVTDAATICASQLPYTWNGVVFTEAGTQTATLQTVNGCDSVVVMTLTVNPTYNVTDAATICETELPYTWNGVVFTEAGTQNATLQTVNGCDSVVVMTLTVNLTYSTLLTEAICQGETYNFFGQALTAAGTYNHTLQAVTGCDSVIILNLTVNPTYAVTDAATICENELPYTWNGVEFTTAGTQNVTLTTVTGCDSVVTMTLTVNPTYAVTDEASICESELPYTWNGIEFTAAGTQNVTLQTVNGCDSVVTMTLIVNLSAVSEFTIETPDSCYEWNDVLYCESGDYTQTLTTVAGCDSVVTLHLTTRVGVNNYELETNVYIAPNPAKSVCRILGLSSAPKYVEVYDMRGGLVMRTNDTEFDVRTLSTGFYMVKVYTGERVINLKLIKE